MVSEPIKFLSDHDIEGYAQLLWGTLASVGWLDFIDLELTTFDEAGLPRNSSDREVWRLLRLTDVFSLPIIEI